MESFKTFRLFFIVLYALIFMFIVENLYVAIKRYNELDMQIKLLNIKR